MQHFASNLHRATSGVYFLGDKPFFAGYFGKRMYTETGEALYPETPFFWDGTSTLISLPLPNDVFFTELAVFMLTKKIITSVD